MREFKRKAGRLTPSGGFMLENGGYSIAFIEHFILFSLTAFEKQIREEVVKEVREAINNMAIETVGNSSKTVDQVLSLPILKIKG